MILRVAEKGDRKLLMKKNFDLAPIPADTSAKLLPIVVLHSAAVEKNTKKSHLDPQNGPVLWPGQSTRRLYVSTCYIVLTQLVTLRVAEKCDQKLHTLRPNRQNVHHPDALSPY